MELRKHPQLWKFLLLLCPYHRWAPAAKGHVNTPVSWWQLRKAALSLPSPAQLIYGAQMDFPPWEMLCYLLLMPSPSEPSSHPACWNWKIHQPPSLFVQDLNVLILLFSSLPFFSSSAQSEFHYSLSFQCPTTSTFIHINSEWQSLTICWECWQQIVS